MHRRDLLFLTGRNSWQLEEAANHWPYFPQKLKVFTEVLEEHGYFVGSSVKSPNRSTGYGNSEMCKLMHQAARSVANHKPHYRDYYQ